MKAKYIIIAIVIPACILAVIFGRKYGINAGGDFFYPTIVNNIPPVDDDLTTLLNEFEAVLKEKNRAAYKALNTGLTADEIRKLEEEYQVKLPEEIVTLYMWHDGSRDPMKPYREGDIVPGHWFVPLEDALKLKGTEAKSGDTFGQSDNYILFTNCMKTWITLFDDGFGDGYFYDPVQTSGSGYVFYHSMEGMCYVYFSSLKNLLKAFIECYQQDVYKFDNTMNLKDYKAMTKIRSKYGVSVN